MLLLPRSRRPRHAGRTARRFLIAGCLLAGLTTVTSASTASAVLPAGSPAAGPASMIPVPLTTPTATTVFRITLPAGAACPGDSATNGYRWQTFIASTTVDITQAVFVGNVITGASGPVDNLYSLDNPVFDQNTAVTTGAIVGLPTTFDLASYPAGTLTAAHYRLGVACTLNGAVERYWSTAITLLLDGSQNITGFTPFNVPGAPTVNAPLSVGTGGRITGTITPVTATPAVTSYTVTATPTAGTPVSVTVTPPATAFTIDGLANRVQYTVTATSTNDAGTSVASAGVTAVPYVNQSAPTQAAGGAAHSCARLANGTVRCWGLNSNGQLGNGTLANSLAPVTPTSLTGVSQVAAGDAFTCAVTTAGAGGKVKCWGLNANGQLGNGTVTRKTVPTQVTTVGTTALVGVSQVAAGANFACAVISPGVNGTVRCWGANNVGQLGDNSTTQRTRPVTVKVNATTVLKGVTAIAAGGGSACARMAAGTVYCWGLGTSGQLGNNTTVSSKLAVPVTGITGATHVAVGANFACARAGTGAVRCWGNNANGQLGDNTITNRKVPVVVKSSATAALSGATNVVAGAGHVCVIRGTGTAARVWCWGANSNGQLGIGSTTGKRIATLVPSSTTFGVKSLGLGAAHSLAIVPSTLRAPSDLAAWGRNANGQLGIAGGTRTTPGIVTAV